MPKLSTILDQVDSGTILLPEFQRGYVWNRDQVRGLMRSLYLGYPVGSLMVWETTADPSSVRSAGTSTPGVRLLLLDGQQRITSLYGVLRGRPPAFFEGNADAFRGLRFNVETEVFEFFAPAKMRDDRKWVDVTALYTSGMEKLLETISSEPELAAQQFRYMKRLLVLYSLLDREFHQEKITGSDKTVDIVVDIFNRVNSGGTKLSKGDLALAKICAEWPEARQSMRSHLDRWSKAGYWFSLDWLLRNTTAIATGRSQFSSLDEVTPTQFQASLGEAARHVGHLLDNIAARLGLDHNRVLMGRYAFPVMSLFLHLEGGKFPDAATRDRLLFWYVHAAIRGRYSGSTESVLARDFDVLRNGGVEGLITEMENWRGGALRITPTDFDSYSLGSRFYPLLYLLTRVSHARNFCDGLPLSAHLLGQGTSLQVHHVFPKALLYQHGYHQSEVNQVGNFCFLTAQCNQSIGAKAPEHYFPAVEKANPGVLASQWIPSDPDLWSIDRYREFLEARRELLAHAANTFLTQLGEGQRASEPAVPSVVLDEREAEDPRSRELEEVRALATELGLAAPLMDSEVADPEDGTVLAIAEAFWPDGLQSGQGQPVVLELDAQEADTERLQELGYELFTSTDALLHYMRRRSRELAGDADEEAPELGEVDAATRMGQGH